jgi:hypothetical protein
MIALIRKAILRRAGLDATLAFIAIGALLLVSCSRSTPQAKPAGETPTGATMTWDAKPRDPCAQQYFDETLCQAAVQNRGYHYGGVWVSTFYTRGYSSYASDHSAFVKSGGTWAPTPAMVYDPGFKPPPAGAVVMGGFGKAAAEAAIRGSNQGAKTSTPAHPTPSKAQKPRPSPVKRKH